METSCLSALPPVKWARQKREIQKSDLFTVFDFANSSKRGEKIVKECNFSTQVLVSYRDEKGRSTICVEFGGTKYVVKLIPTAESKKFGMMSIQDDPTTAHYYFNSQLNGIALLWNRFNYLFDKNTKRSLTFNNTDRDIRDTFAIQDPSRIVQLRVFKDPVTREELFYLSQNFPMVTDFLLHSTPPADCECFPMGYQMADIRYNIELKLSHLESIQCKGIIIRDAKITTDTINQFIVKWRDGKCSKKLRNMLIYCVTPTTNLFDKLHLYPWDHKQRARYSSLGWDCAKGFDLKKKDGTLATIMFKNCVFWLTVWKKRFPKQPEIQKAIGAK